MIYPRMATIAARWLAAILLNTASFPARGQPNASRVHHPQLELVRATVANEVAADNDTSVKHMFRDDKETPQGSQTRIYVETRQAMAGMTIA